ncbi:MAG: hypothetical protein KBT75_01890 [Oleispira antarctica]|nr:hypothetical protein [Oleispira antarctica]MBQ0792718.1 hypothetical protein [Oleispira antarctica]
MPIVGVNPLTALNFSILAAVPTTSPGCIGLKFLSAILPVAFSIEVIKSINFVGLSLPIL